MPKEVKIKKDKILDAAFEITKEKGIECVSNREIAKRLKCSIRPIYYQFANVEELKAKLYQKIERFFYEFLLDNLNEEMPKYKQVGINYIKFAKEEKHLFKVLFMSKSEYSSSDFITKDIEDFKSLSLVIKKSTKLTEEEIMSFHTKMWIFTHGIATLVATDTVEFTDEQIKSLLSQEFQALMLQKENKRSEKVK